MTDLKNWIFLWRSFLLKFWSTLRAHAKNRSIIFHVICTFLLCWISCIWVHVDVFLYMKFWAFYRFANVKSNRRQFSEHQSDSWRHYLCVTYELKHMAYRALFYTFLWCKLNTKSIFVFETFKLGFETVHALHEMPSWLALLSRLFLSAQIWGEKISDSSTQYRSPNHRVLNLHRNDRKSQENKTEMENNNIIIITFNNWRESLN